VDPRPSYDEKLLGILRSSAAVFADKGYDRASIRDIAQATGVSLSGLYYYVSSKEELLFLIQDHCFGTLHHRLEELLVEVTDPGERVRVFIRNHLRFFLANQAEMKVLSHEADALSGEFAEQILRRKRSYARAAQEILEGIAPPDAVESRTATFALFGMMNWIYTWHREDVDPGADALSERISHLFLNGYLTPPPPERPGVTDGSAPSIWRS
jgi:TetR/AcrR family transcriptional regulator, cholesterol catabolism regulator